MNLSDTFLLFQTGSGFCERQTKARGLILWALGTRTLVFGGLDSWPEARGLWHVSQTMGPGTLAVV